MKRSPAALTKVAPSPRSASVASGAGSSADIDGRRVKLDELRVADHRAGARRHGDRFAACIWRVGRHRIEAADAARRQDHGASGKILVDLFARGAGAHEAHTFDAAVGDDELIGFVALENADRRRCAHLGDQRVEYGGAGAISGYMHDAAARVRQQTLEVTQGRGNQAFIVDDYPGIGYLFAVASPNPLDFTEITRGDYWDYRVIDDGRIQGDPYVALTDLAARIAPVGDYDYDVVPYYVERHYDYPRFVCYDCHAYAGYSDWDPYRSSCTRFRVVIRDDPRYYPYRYGGRKERRPRPIASSWSPLRVPRCRSRQRLCNPSDRP